MVNVTRKIPFALLCTPLLPEALDALSAQTPRTCSKRSPLELLLFNTKTRGLPAPEDLESIKYQRVVTINTPRNQAQSCFGNLYPSNVPTCQSVALSTMALWTSRSSAEILRMTQGDSRGPWFLLYALGWAIRVLPENQWCKYPIRRFWIARVLW